MVHWQLSWRRYELYCTLLLALEQNAIMSDMAVYIDGYLSKIREWVECMDIRYPLDCYDSYSTCTCNGKKQENISGKHSQHFTWIPAKPKPTMGNIWQINFSCLSLSHFVNAKLKSSRQALSSRTKLLWANSRARSDFQPKFSSLKLRTKPLRMGGCNVTQPGCILSIYSGPNLLGKVWNWSTHWPDTFTERERMR